MDPIMAGARGRGLLECGHCEFSAVVTGVLHHSKQGVSILTRIDADIRPESPVRESEELPSITGGRLTRWSIWLIGDESLSSTLEKQSATLPANVGIRSLR